VTPPVNGVGTPAVRVGAVELRGEVSMLSRATKLILVLALVAGSLAIAAPAANAAPTYTVKAKTNDRWTGTRPLPFVTTHAAKPGAKVIIKWKNPTTRQHDVKSLNIGKDWTMSRKILRPNNKNVVKRTFNSKGRYYFRCTIHSAKVEGEWKGMVGQVHVYRP
jgi:plastocyanin